MRVVKQRGRVSRLRVRVTVQRRGKGGEEALVISAASCNQLCRLSAAPLFIAMLMDGDTLAGVLITGCTAVCVVYN